MERMIGLTSPTTRSRLQSLWKRLQSLLITTASSSFAGGNSERADELTKALFQQLFKQFDLPAILRRRADKLRRRWALLPVSLGIITWSYPRFSRSGIIEHIELYMCLFRKNRIQWLVFRVKLLRSRSTPRGELAKALTDFVTSFCLVESLQMSNVLIMWMVICYTLKSFLKSVYVKLASLHLEWILKLKFSHTIILVVFKFIWLLAIILKLACLRFIPW